MADKAGKRSGKRRRRKGRKKGADGDGDGDGDEEDEAEVSGLHRRSKSAGALYDARRLYQFLTSPEAASDATAATIEFKRLVVRFGVDVCVQHKATPLLMWACRARLPGVVEVILGAGANANETNVSGESALQWAAEVNDIASMRVLLEAGAAINSKSKDGTTAAHVAAREGHTVALDLLRQHGARLSARDSNKDTPLHLALKAPHPHTSRLLVKWGASLTKKNGRGETPLHVAARTATPELCAYMAAKGGTALAAMQTPEGKTAADLGGDDVRTAITAATLVREPKCGRPIEAKEEDVAFFSSRLSVDAPASLYVLLSITANILTHALIVMPDTPDAFPEAGHYAYFALAVTTLASWFTCSLSDPGYIPRPEATAMDAEYERWVHLGREDCVCELCRTYKPLRAHHCRICDRCVEEFDHHCPWMANCIGVGNYRSFYAFLVSVVSALFITITANVLFVLDIDFSSQLTNAVIVCVVLLNTTTLLMFAGLMLVVHTDLIRRGLTTYESLRHFRHDYLRDAQGAFYNPHDRGCLKNCLAVCIRRRRPHIPRPVIRGDIEKVNSAERHFLEREGGSRGAFNRRAVDLDTQRDARTQQVRRQIKRGGGGGGGESSQALGGPAASAIPSLQSSSSSYTATIAQKLAEKKQRERDEEMELAAREAEKPWERSLRLLEEEQQRAAEEARAAQEQERWKKELKRIAAADATE